MKYHIHRLCRDEKTIEDLKKQEKKYNLPNTEYVTGIDLFQFINEILRNCKDDYALIVHDDVILPKNIDDNVLKCINEANSFMGENNWAIIGNTGVEVLTKRVLIFLTDPNTNLLIPGTKHPIITESVDGNLMLLNLKNLREKSAWLPNTLSGFHLYDLVLCLESAKNGLLSAVSSRLYAIHKSGGNRGSFEVISKSNDFQNYFNTDFSNPKVTSINGEIVVKETNNSLPSIEKIIESNIINSFKNNTFNLHFLMDISNGSKGLSRMLSSLERLEKELNHNVKLSLHLYNIEENKESTLKNILVKHDTLTTLTTQLEIDQSPVSNFINTNEIKNIP